MISFVMMLLVSVVWISSPTPAASAEEVDLVGAKNDQKIDMVLAQAMNAESNEMQRARRAGPRPVKKIEHTQSVDPIEPPAELPEGIDVGKNYKVQPGDVLHITVWREDNMDREVIVLPDGTISFPLIGSLDINGMTTTQVQRKVKHALRSLIPDASVTVVVKATLGNAVSVIGQVGKPGEIIMNHGLSVMQALSQAGGLTPYAEEDEIIILRRVDGEQVSIEFPYDEISRGRELDKNIDLLPGDVVVVPTAGLF